MTYHNRIRNLREEKQLNQTAVASLTGVQQKTYSDYEIGKTRIPVESLIVLARFYNVNMDYITGVSDERKPFPKKLKPSPSPEGRCSRSGGTQAAARRGGPRFASPAGRRHKKQAQAKCLRLFIPERIGKLQKGDQLRTSPPFAPAFVKPAGNGAMTRQPREITEYPLTNPANS